MPQPQLIRAPAFAYGRYPLSMSSGFQVRPQAGLDVPMTSERRRKCLGRHQAISIVYGSGVGCQCGVDLNGE